MDFTNRRFLSPPIREYKPLEDDFSATMKRNPPESFMGFKMYILSLQKAINQKKWPHELELMINLSKLVKPVLHLPYLEDGRFNQ